MRPIFDVWPKLETAAPFRPLGDFPTRVEARDELALAVGAPKGTLWEKRDDQTSPIYGGNKVRTIEVLFGHALKEGCTHIYSTGAYGSNHAVAAAMHAPRVGLTAGIVVYPQPHSPSALENLELLLSRTPRPPVRDLPHWSALPYGMIRQSLDSRLRGERAYIMVPGGAIPLGALGYVSAGFELAMQVAAGEMPSPATVVVAIGSNCTSAGLLAGFVLAHRLGLGFERVPRLVAVRVTPWPVTSVTRILGLSVRCSELIASIVGEDRLRLARADLRPHFRLETQHIGDGYGFATNEGREAVALWAAHAGHALETTYSGKAAAHVLMALRRQEPGPLLYWATKSSATLPPVSRGDLAWAPRRMRRWMDKARSSKVTSDIHW
jgi:D-cysteine desulfhydrase